LPQSQAVDAYQKVTTLFICIDRRISTSSLDIIKIDRGQQKFIKTQKTIYSSYNFREFFGQFDIGA